MRPEFLHIAGIREIASPFSRDIDLLSGFLRLFQNSDRRALIRRCTGSHKTCRAGSDDNNMSSALLSLHSFLIQPSVCPSNSPWRGKDADPLPVPHFLSAMFTV